MSDALKRRIEELRLILRRHYVSRYAKDLGSDTEGSVDWLLPSSRLNETHDELLRLEKAARVEEELRTGKKPLTWISFPGRTQGESPESGSGDLNPGKGDEND